jgi:chromosome partitioning protein
MADFRTNLTNEVIKEIKTFFKNKVFETIIPRNIKLSEAPSFGKPCVLYDAESKGSVNYLNLAKELIAKNEEVEA